MPHYIKRVQDVAARLDFSLEVVIVANDATEAEQNLLDTFQSADNLSVNIIHTERETLYASWNRGIAAAQHDLIGFWNVDDIRSVEGLIAGYNALASGEFQLVDSGYDVVEGHEVARYDVPYRQDLLAPKAGVSPFFMLHRTLYETAGAFNEHFKITGDYEWSKRPAVREASYKPLPITGGQFILHDNNLSGGRNPLEWIEFNIALIWHGGFQHLRPVDPDIMRDTWDAWGHTGGEIPDNVAEWLWGSDARQRYEAFTSERKAHPLLRRVRLALARRGWVRSVEWEVMSDSPDADEKP